MWEEALGGATAKMVAEAAAGAAAESAAVAAVAAAAAAAVTIVETDNIAAGVAAAGGERQLGQLGCVGRGRANICVSHILKPLITRPRENAISDC